MYSSNFPTVRAFPGPLPEGRDGVEFETDVPPTKGSPPSEKYWKLTEGCDSRIEMPLEDFASISVKIRKVRYSKQVNLQPRCEWKAPWLSES